jgi:hypothetical protein
VFGFWGKSLNLHSRRKQKAESRKQKAESRKQKAESRKQKAESRKQKAITANWQLPTKTRGISSSGRAQAWHV